MQFKYYERKRKGSVMTSKPMGIFNLHEIDINNINDNNKNIKIH